MNSDSSAPARLEPVGAETLPRPKALDGQPSRRHLPIATDAPDVVPARMVNEVLYCERLLYLEWAQGEFEDNVFTADGRVVHRRVDAGRGVLPPPTAPANGAPRPDEERTTRRISPDDDTEDAPPPWTARSVWLTSEKLGLTAKLDVVESEDGKVIPVEHKRGRSLPGRGAYLPEKAQVCAHVLLLREHGYDAPHGEIWFAAERRRATIEIDDNLINVTLRAIARAKEVVLAGKIPEPLDDHPKCRGCSLVGICLPDETTLLKGLADAPLDAPQTQIQLMLDLGSDASGPLSPEPWGLAGEPPIEHPIRRIHPARDDRTVLYVTAQGARLALDGDVLRVETSGAHPTHARLPQTSHVCVYGNVQITTQALAALLERDIPVLFFSSGGFLRGRTTGHGTKNVELRVAQYRAADDAETAIELARAFVVAKIRNQRTMLRRNAVALDVQPLNELESLARKAEMCGSVESLLGLEGTAARTYFGGFAKMLKGDAAGDFDLTSRNRRPPKDPINALLSFAYSLLTKDYVASVLAAGLDPLLGFLHKPRYGRPALALDLMEEMRPLVADSAVVNALNTGVVGPDDFVRSPAGCALSTSARKRFIESYERRVDQLISHPIFGYRISYRRVFEVQARLLGRRLLGEIPDYPAFRTR